MKNVATLITLFMFVASSLFAQNLTEQEKIQLDKKNVEIEMQDYQPVNLDDYTSNGRSDRDEGYITIGDGTDYGSWPAYYSPWGNYWHNVHTQNLYLASELGGEELLITELAWFFERVAPAGEDYWDNVSIKVLEVSDEELATGDYYDLSGATEILSASTMTGPSETGWFTFDVEDFTYSGTQNLLVDIVWGDNGYYDGNYFRTLKTETGAVRTLLGYSDSETPPDYDNSAATVDNLRVTYFETPSEPTFAINQESYTFEEVGLLDGEVFYPAENAEYSITNIGMGSFNITSAPSFFSLQDEAFNYVDDGATFPYEIAGPYPETGESFDFEVEFAPTAAGESQTLLVIEDDLGRVTRTYDIFGSAYDIPDYDIVENAYMITQDWDANADFDAADNFDNFYDDYRLDPTADADVVYHFSVNKDSYVNFNDVTGVSQFSVFAEGDAIEEDNNLYEGGQLGVPTGSYYIVASGSGEFDFTLNIEGQEPVLLVDPTSIDLGDVPINCWHEGGTFMVLNDGGQTITFESASLSDENGVYTLEHDYEFPLTISTDDTLYFNVYLDEADVANTFDAAFLLEDETTTHIYPITGNAYTPVLGDVICDPIIASFDATGHFEDDNSVAAPMVDNYHIVDGYNDVVYKFSYANDFIVDIALDNAAMDPQLALYDAQDVATTDPDQLTPIAEGGQDILDKDLWAGTYYLVVAGDQTTTPEYTLTLDVEDMPAPGAITLLTPADGSNEIPVDPTLTWELGEYTENIDVYVDTQYPPQDKVLGNGIPVETFDVDNLSPAQIYFWKVVAHNSNGSTESETWAFTTTLPAPLYVQGTVFDYENVHLTWNNPFDATFKVTEDFENGELPEGWTMTTNATGSSAGWFITDAGGSGAFSIPPHTIYAVSNDDANDGDGSEDYLIMPPQNFAQWEGASLTFESFYTGDYGHSAYVEVSTDGGSTYQVADTLEPNDGWTSVTVDLNDYVVSGNTEVHVAFHADDNGAWASGWAVDDVELNFEGALGGGSRALLGYNVYQNGTQINDETVFVEEYDVMELAAGDYVFGVSAVYDEGESAITEIETITILGIGGIEGTVTDADSGDGIEGANLTITGMWDEEELTYSATTDADGMYSVETPVLADGDTYTVEVSASGYADDMEEDVVVSPETNTTVDFVLGDIPLPVTSVVAAQDENETEATITWEAPGEGGELVELSQHDNTPENGYFQSFDMGYGVVYDLTEYTDAMLEYVDFHHASWGVTGTWEYKIHVVNWDTYEEIAVLGPYETTGNDTWETEVDLGTITGLGGNQIGIFMEPMGNAADDAYPDLSSDNSGPDGMSVFGTIGDYENFEASTIGDFLMDLWITTAMGDAPVMASKVVTPTGNHQAEPRIASQATPEEYITVNQQARSASNDRVLQSYEVWRLMEGEEGTPSDWTLLADDVTETEYVDAEWADQEMGVYRYAVKAIYTVTESEPALSNLLGKDMLSNVLVMVELNTGDTPSGVNITLENLDYPEYIYIATTDETGQVQFPELWKGNYLVTASKDGYEIYTETHEIMESYYIIEILLKEALVSPINLTADVACSDVTLSWEEGTYTGGDLSWTQDFEEGFPPEGWLMETNSSVGWFQTDDGSSSFFEIPSNGSLYACSNDDAANDDGSVDYLITPQQSFIGYASGTLTFESFYDGGFGQLATVELSTDGGNTWEVIHTVAASDSWEDVTVDLSDYLTNDYAEVWIGFHSDDDGGWASGWAIDNVSLELSSGARGTEDTREIVGFNVYRDGQMLTNSPITETTYVDEGVPGGQYDYTVSATFTTGESDPSEVASVEVESINPAENLTAEKQAHNNVFVSWEPPSDQAIYSLRYDDGENFNAIGTGDVFDFAVASRWTPDQLGTYDGMYLTEISFFPSEADCEYYLRVWTGEDATLVSEQLVTDVTIGEWNTVQLDTPVMIDSGEEFWFGYRANAQTGYPAGTDAGPAVAGYGDMIYDAESGWLSMAEAYGLDYNWNLVGTVVSGDGEQSQLAQVEETITPSASDAAISQGEINNNPVAFNNAGRDLSGYTLYRSDELLADNIQQLFYIDYDVQFPVPFPEEGVTHTYYVVANYASGCEAAPSNEAEVYWGVNIDDLGNDISIYPNPAKEFVNIELTNNVETLRVINYIGQEVYSKTITDENIVTVDNLEAGAYIVRMTTNNGETVTKRFVVVK